MLEAVRCLLFFPFDIYVIVPWTKELNPPEHTLTFIDLFLNMMRIFHLASIVLWIGIWFRNQRGQPIKHQLLVSSDSSMLIKEDKCISAYPYSNSINVINQRKPWHVAVYTITVIVSITFMWFVFALRFEECNTILKNTIQHS